MTGRFAVPSGICGEPCWNLGRLPSARQQTRLARNSPVLCSSSFPVSRELGKQNSSTFQLALKEWAPACAALGAGEQLVLHSFPSACLLCSNRPSPAAYSMHMANGWIKATFIMQCIRIQTGGLPEELITCSFLTLLCIVVRDLAVFRQATQCTHGPLHEILRSLEKARAGALITTGERGRLCLMQPCIIPDSCISVPGIERRD